uniref:Uncharacterized protein n=1 Tax=Arundo donax TaxID=35708 RepID=A0A0A9AK89_ARUDO
MPLPSFTSHAPSFPISNLLQNTQRELPPLHLILRCQPLEMALQPSKAYPRVLRTPLPLSSAPKPLKKCPHCTTHSGPPPSQPLASSHHFSGSAPATWSPPPCSSPLIDHRNMGS